MDFAPGGARLHDRCYQILILAKKKCLKKVQKKPKMPIETGAKVAPKTSKKEQKREKYRLKLEQSGSKNLQKLPEKWKTPNLWVIVTYVRTYARTDERTQIIFVSLPNKKIW